MAHEQTTDEHGELARPRRRGHRGGHATTVRSGGRRSGSGDPCLLDAGPDVGGLAGGERSADLVEHIALRTGALTSGLPDDVRMLFAEMGTQAVAMWRTAGTAWVQREVSAAEQLRMADDIIDDLHVRVTARLATVTLTTPEAIELGLVARFFERLGDHAVNVTRRLTFLAPEGERVPEPC